MVIQIKSSAKYPNDWAKRELTHILYLCNGDDLDFTSYFYFENGTEYRKKFNAKTRELELESLSYRILNHWEKEGLISSDRGAEGRGWRKFSIMDRIWIEIIVSLRKIGVSNENIKKVKQALTYTCFEGSEFPYLEYNCARFLREQEPTYLLVFSDFHAEVARQMVIEKAHLFGELKDDHIRINLGELISRIYKGQELKTKYSVNPELDSNDLDLLSDIRSQQYHEIAIEVREGKIVKSSKTVANPDKELHKAVKSVKNGEVTAFVKDGNIVGIRKTIKEKKS